MGYQVTSGGITRELDKEPLLHCSSIYINTKWSMLQQCVSLMSIHPASTSCLLLILHAFTLRPPCFSHVPWHHTFNLRYTCAHYMYTIRNSCPLMSSPNPNSISRLFPILLDYSTWLPDHVLSICCRLIKYYLIYVQLTLTLAKVCPHSRSITMVFL